MVSASQAFRSTRTLDGFCRCSNAFSGRSLCGRLQGTELNTSKDFLADHILGIVLSSWSCRCCCVSSTFSHLRVKPHLLHCNEPSSLSSNSPPQIHRFCSIIQFRASRAFKLSPPASFCKNTFYSEDMQQDQAYEVSKHNHNKDILRSLILCIFLLFILFSLQSVNLNCKSFTFLQEKLPSLSVFVKFSDFAVCNYEIFNLDARLHRKASKLKQLNLLRNWASSI